MTELPHTNLIVRPPRNSSSNKTSKSTSVSLVAIGKKKVEHYPIQLLPSILCKYLSILVIQ